MIVIPTITINANTRYAVTAFAIPCGSDWNITVYGGTHPHIGALSVTAPDKATMSDNISTILFPDHRDDAISSLFAKKISLAFNNCTIAVSAGIHIDHATPAEIELFLKSSEECCEKLILEMKKLKK